MVPEIQLPIDICAELRKNTAAIINHLAVPVDEPGQWRRRSHAPSIVLVLERSGAISASGILDWYERNQVEGVELIVVEGIGSEIRGDPMWDDIPLYMFDEGEFDDVSQDLAKQIDDPDHPMYLEAERVAAALARLPDGGHTVGLIDDYVSRGHVAAIYTPIFFRKAAARAGYGPAEYADIAWPVMEDVKYHLNLGEFQHSNQFSKRSPALACKAMEANLQGTRSLSFPWENVWTLLPSFDQWMPAIAAATFGSSPLSDSHQYELNEWLRGGQQFSWWRSDGDNPYVDWIPEHSAAMRVVTALGVDPADAPGYLQSLSLRLRQKIVDSTRETRWTAPKGETT